MTMPAGQPEQAAARAIRYTLAVLGEEARRAAGGDPDDAPLGVDMTVDEALALAPALARLAIAARCAIAAQLGITGEAGQAEFARGQLLAELEIHEIGASFADVEAEFAKDQPPRAS